MLNYIKHAWHLCPVYLLFLHHCPHVDDDAAAANIQNIVRAINNFEDVFGEGSKYDNYDSEDSTTNTDNNENHRSTSQNATRPSTSGNHCSPCKRKSAVLDPDNDDASQMAKCMAKHTAKQPVHDDDSQALLEQSHL